MRSERSSAGTSARSLRPWMTSGARRAPKGSRETLDKVGPMDEVLELCRRVLGQASSAQQAAAQAHAEGRRGRVTKLAAAIKACRALAEDASDEQPSELPPEDQPSTQLGRRSRRLSPASSRAPARDFPSASARCSPCVSCCASHTKRSRGRWRSSRRRSRCCSPRARLRLQVERRGTSADLGAGCAEGERALRLLACRQDSEPVSAADQEWLLQHMAQCEACERAHAAMLEASVCYRAWLPEEAPAPAPAVEPAVAAPDNRGRGASRRFQSLEPEELPVRGA